MSPTRRRRSETGRTLLTDRIIQRLPGPRWLGIALWIGVLGLQLVLVAALDDPAVTAETILDQDPGDLAIAVYLLLLSLVAGPRLVRRAEREIDELSPVAPRDVRQRWLRGVDGWAGPLVIAVAFTALEVGEAMAAHGPGLLALVPTSLIVHLPAATAGWALLVMIAALDRIGRSSLNLDPYGGDPNLGLKPAGRLAFTAYMLLVAGVTPVLIRYTTSLFALTVNLPLFVAATLLIVVALGRVHRQMVRARDAALQRARERWTEAFAPVRRVDDLATLADHSPLLSAAENLERRVERVKTWPVTGGIVGQILLISVSIITGLVSRVVTSAVGL